MAKSKKPKKRKYTTRNEMATEIKNKLNAHVNLDGPEFKTVEKDSSLSNRASETASIFIDDCRVFVRNLTDPILMREKFGMSLDLDKMRRQLDSLELVYIQFCRETQYRKLG